MRGRYIGRCYWCRRPVRSVEAARVWDPAVRIYRLVHGSPCRGDLEHRIGRERW